MKANRRDFIKGAGVFAASLGGAASAADGCGAKAWLETDVLVVGGGPAGVCAAIAAARNGAKTLVVERGNCLGGMATRGLVGPFMTCYDKSGKTQIIRGLFNEIVERLVARGEAIHPRDCMGGTAFTSWIKVGHDHCTPFEPEGLKLLLDRMCSEAGVKVLFHADFAEPLMDGARIAGARLFTKAGMRDVRAKVVVDATGDGDVAFRAGVPTEYGDPRGRRVQPASMFFRIGNCDLKAITADIEANKDNFYRKDGVNYRSLHWRVAEARAAGDWNLKRVSIGLFRGVKEDEWSINTSRIMGVDSTDPESWSSAESEGREQVDQIFRFFRKYVPGCRDARLLCSGSTIGVRESRHIFGEYRLTVDDCLEGRVPADSILLASNSVDVHGRFGPMSNQYMTVKNGEWYGVPYRCLVPLKVDGLLVAGRCLSAESEAAGAVRVMPPVMAMGQAAGTAAALCVKTGATPRALDTGALVRTLREQGAFLGGLAPFIAKPEAFDPNGGHIQGIAASEDALYVSQMTRLVKLDWKGNVLATRTALSHTGDIAWHDGELYAAVAVYPERKEGRIQVYDGNLNLLREAPVDRTIDGIAYADGILYVGMGAKEQPSSKPHRVNVLGRFDAKTLREVAPRAEFDYGHETKYAFQNIVYDEGRLAASFYAVAGSPGVVFFDKDLKILGTVSERCNQGFDVLPAAMRGAGGRFVRAKTTITKSPDSVSCAFDVVDLEV